MSNKNLKIALFIALLLLVVSNIFWYSKHKSCIGDKKEIADTVDSITPIIDSISCDINKYEKRILFGCFDNDGLCNPYIQESNIKKYVQYLNKQEEFLMPYLESNQKTSELFDWIENRILEVMANIEEIEELIWSNDVLVCGQYKMEYRKCITHPEKDGKATLVLELHGKLPEGTYPLHLGHGQKCIRNYMEAKGEKCIILLPTSPNRSDWYPFLSDLKMLIEQYEGDTDPNRIYIAGESNGGLGTWQMLNRYPTLFSGAMPVAVDVNGDINKYPSVRICATQELAKEGGASLFNGTENKRFDHVGDNHGDCIHKSFTTERMEWLFE